MMKLVDDWKASWRWWSMQSMGLVTVLLGAWGVMPEDLKQTLPSWLVHGVAIIVLMTGIVGRILQQEFEGPHENHGIPMVDHPL